MNLRQLADDTRRIRYGDLSLERDLLRGFNQDFSRHGGQTFTGLFGINQHWGYDNREDNIGRSSAGCLVGRTRQGHRDFMAHLEKDERHVANNRYQFVSTILHVDML